MERVIDKVMDRQLCLEKTLEYLKEWREFKNKEALTSLVIGNGGLVNFWVKKYLNKGLTFDELVSIGNEALIRAINKFDYKDKDIKLFSSYISISIENTIKTELKKYYRHSNVLSFEYVLGQNKDGNELKLEDTLGTDVDELEENIMAKMKRDLVRETLKSLPLREQQVILLRYGLYDNPKKTLKEVAEIFDCSITTVVNREHKALIKMRQSRNTKKLKDFLD